jgi:HTH-type transcriptional regulator/antitoxin HipB
MQVKTSSDISALIRDRRTHLAWSQADLAKRVGVSRIWIIQLEKGKPTAQIGLTLRTLKELGIMLDASASAAASSRRTVAAAIDLNRIVRGKSPAKS